MGKKLNIWLIVSLMLLLIFPSLSAQKELSFREAFLEADSYLVYEEYNDALPLFAKLKDKNPDNYNLDYRIGRCYLNISHDKAKSIYYLERAVKHINPKITKESDWKETNAPVDAFFYLGDAYRINNKLEKAIETYLQFKAMASDKLFDFTLVDNQIAATKRAIALMRTPVDIDETNLGPVINTSLAEFNPVVNNKETMLVYASRQKLYLGMFYCQKENGQWTNPMNMMLDLGIDGDCVPTSISADGTELYTYRSDQFLGDIYVTNFKNDSWTKLRKLNSNINTKYWESHACISPDGKTLYFTSNRPGGIGGLDIYKSTRTSGDNWGAPVNLGPTINSEYNEDTPFMSADGKTLYFSSFGHETMGGYDIFVSKMNVDGSWGKPQNIGYPINTPDDDLFYCPVKNGIAGYTAKYSPDGQGRTDIYRYDIYSDANPRKYIIRGNILLSDMPVTNEQFYVSIYDKIRRDTIFSQYINGKDFKYETIWGNYDVIVKRPGYKPQTVALNITKGSKTKEKEVQTSLLPEKKIEYLTSVADTRPAVGTTSLLNNNSMSKVALDSKTGKPLLVKPSAYKSPQHLSLVASTKDSKVIKPKVEAKASKKAATSTKKHPEKKLAKTSNTKQTKSANQLAHQNTAKKQTIASTKAAVKPAPATNHIAAKPTGTGSGRALAPTPPAPAKVAPTPAKVSGSQKQVPASARFGFRIIMAIIAYVAG